jgi:hypothetical protein
MRISMLCSACLVIALAPSGALAKANDPASATCEAKYYDYLVGKNLDAARDISGTTNYRVLANGAAPGAAQPRRMTITVDPKSNQILNVACG